MMAFILPTDFDFIAYKLMSLCTVNYDRSKCGFCRQLLVTHTLANGGEAGVYK